MARDRRKQKAKELVLIDDVHLEVTKLVKRLSQRSMSDGIGLTPSQLGSLTEPQIKRVYVISVLLAQDLQANGELVINSTAGWLWGCTIAQELSQSNVLDAVVDRQYSEAALADVDAKYPPKGLAGKVR